LVGVDAFTTPGSYRLRLDGEGVQPWQEFLQDLPIRSANFNNQLIEVPDELNGLLDPELRQQEDQFLDEIYSNFSDQQLWDGYFQVPVTDTIVTAPYGGGRSYNEGPVTSFHTGTDFNGQIGTPILAAANGIVKYNDTL
jgi:murein DD-endopeptidase MepM/ murein hydrolase activator NlpD